MKGLMSCVVVLSCCAIVRADDYLVTPKGIWRIQNGIPVAMTDATDRIHFAGDPGGNPPLPPDRPDPPSGDVLDDIKSITKDFVQSEQEATGLVSILRLFLRDDVDESKIEEGLDKAVAVLKASPVFPGNQFDEWWEAVQGLGQDFDSSFVELLEKGVRETWGLARGSMETKADVAAISLPEIIDLIKLILELLKDLGIFDKSASFVASGKVEADFIFYDSLLATLDSIHEETPWNR